MDCLESAKETNITDFMQGQKVPKKSTQKCKYIENKKSFQDEMKSIFYHFDRTFIEADGAAPDPKCV